MKLTDLTPRRRQIVELLADGKEDKQIAEELGVTPSAVRSTFNRLERDLGIWGKIAVLKHFYELNPR